MLLLLTPMETLSNVFTTYSLARVKDFYEHVRITRGRVCCTNGVICHNFDIIQSMCAERLSGTVFVNTVTSVRL